MLLIISSPISSHVKQKEGGNAAIIRHTLYPSVELCSTKQAEMLGVKKKDQHANIWEGEEKKQQLYHSQPHLATQHLGFLGKFDEEERKITINP